MKIFRKDLQKNYFNEIGKMFILNAFADEQSTSSETSNKNNVDLGVLLAQARQEEKDKLYPEIQRLKSEKDILQKQANDALMEAGRVKQELEELKKKQDEGKSEEITKLQAKIEALTEENKKLKESAPKEEDIRKQLEAEYELKSYLKDKLAENKNKILSVYAKQVKGKTKEEIDAAIEKAIKDSDEIRKEVNGGEDNSDKKDKSNTSDIKNKKNENNPPANNPSVNIGSKEYSLEYIQGLDPRSKEYAEFRKSVGLKI